MDKRLIATDFDGTLFINGEIPACVREAIDLWRADGRYFGIVTGRGEDFFDKVKEIKLPVDYFIIYNGSMIADKEGNVISERFISPDIYAELEKVFSGYGDTEYYSRADGNAQHHYYATFNSVERALEVKEDIDAVFGDKLAVFVNGRHVNIGAAGTGKAQGVNIVLEHFALPCDSAAVVGDDYNDLEMIKTFDGWAVESGKPDVVSQAPHICKDVGNLALMLLNNSY
ncbi:MAG: HAD family phosphatase [Clostridia bacterium]|nr:HAD family phosphatase [Clostridia bacterium]